MFLSIYLGLVAGNDIDVRAHCDWLVPLPSCLGTASQNYGMYNMVSYFCSFMLIDSSFHPGAIL